MDQTSFWTFDAAGAPGNCVGPLMASSEPGRMLAFAPFQGFIRGMSAKLTLRCHLNLNWRDIRRSHSLLVPQASSERLGPAQSHLPAHCVGPPRLTL